MEGPQEVKFEIKLGTSYVNAENYNCSLSQKTIDKITKFIQGELFDYNKGYVTYREEWCSWPVGETFSQYHSEQVIVFEFILYSRPGLYNKVVAIAEYCRQLAFQKSVVCLVTDVTRI